MKPDPLRFEPDPADPNRVRFIREQRGGIFRETLVATATRGDRGSFHGRRVLTADEVARIIAWIDGKESTE